MNLVNVSNDKSAVENAYLIQLCAGMNACLFQQTPLCNCKFAHYTTSDNVSFHVVSVRLIIIVIIYFLITHAHVQVRFTVSQRTFCIYLHR